MQYGFAVECDSPCPLLIMTLEQYPGWLSDQESIIQNQLNTTKFTAKAGCYASLINSDGQLESIVTIIDLSDSVWCLSGLVAKLPACCYQIIDLTDSLVLEQALLGWALAHYQFDRYKTMQDAKSIPCLLVEAKQYKAIEPMATAIFAVRDLVNTPANKLGPSELYQAAQRLAKKYHAQASQVVGRDLLDQNLNAIWTVGAAGEQLPRLIELTWGDPSHEHITLVGKGVCFDTGGLDLKPAAAMRLMKKDMGGAAHVLGLAELIMVHELPVYLQVLIPAVENNVSANAYRPGDVIRMANGTTVEIGDTDAEGRLVVADAFTVAKQHQPAILIDFTTLTGAARVALGLSVAAMFCNDDDMAQGLQESSHCVKDPLWRLPLVPSYRRYLKSDIADQNNVSKTPYGGAITAALFLQSFLPDEVHWLHFDIMAWNTEQLPGRPVGGEAMALRAVFRWLQLRYANDII